MATVHKHQTGQTMARRSAAKLQGRNYPEISLRPTVCQGSKGTYRRLDLMLGKRQVVSHLQG